MTLKAVYRQWSVTTTTRQKKEEKKKKKTKKKNIKIIHLSIHPIFIHLYRYSNTFKNKNKNLAVLLENIIIHQK